MHLCLLSDATISDLLDDAGRRASVEQGGVGRQQLDGLLRGLVFAMGLAVPLALTFVPSVLGSSHPHAGIAARP